MKLSVTEERDYNGNLIVYLDVESISEEQNKELQNHYSDFDLDFSVDYSGQIFIHANRR